MLADSSAVPDALTVLLTQYKSYIVLFCVAAACTYLGTPIYIRLAVSRGWLDRPGGRKAHDSPVPTMGGLVVFLTVFTGIAVTLAWGNRVSAMLRDEWWHVTGAVVCTLAMIAIGVVDDLRGVRAKLKLLAQIAVALAAYGAGFAVERITIPGIGTTALGGWSVLLTLVWIVGITNAVNFTDGLDGLAAGVCFLAAGVNAGVAIWLGNYYMAVMMILLAGALLGFLRWNFHPARVFLGDAGSQGLGMFLALCSLHSAQKAHTAVMILVPLAALGYPIMDMLLAVGRRTLRGQPLFASDRDHIHHRLLARGHSPSQTAILIYAASIIIIAACLVAMTVNHPIVGIAVGAVLMLALFSVRVLGYIEWGGWAEREETKLLHAAANLARLRLRNARTPDDVLRGFSVFAEEAGFDSLVLQRGDNELSWGSRNGAPDSSRLKLPLAADWLLNVDGPSETVSDADRRSLIDDLGRTAARTIQSWPDAMPKSKSG